MRDHDYTATADFLKRFFGETLHKVELRACPNVKGSKGALSKMTDNDLQRLSFCIEKDVDGMGVYFGVCTRYEIPDKDGKISGNLETVAECPALWVDIDCAKQGIAGADAIAALQYLPHPPSLIVNSGGGLHAYWLLEEPVDVSVGQHNREVVTACLRQLAMVLAGDLQCAELARILRLPGTMNSKPATKALYDGAAALCEVIEDTGQVHDFETLRLWLGTQRAVLHGKIEAPRPVVETDPFARYAREAGYEPAIDVEAELAAIQPGHDRHGIHPTQLRVSMSLLARGYEDDEIVDMLLKATAHHAPANDPWDWSAEERALRKMVASGKKKAEDRRERPMAPQPMSNGNAALAIVHDMEEERAKREPKATSATKDKTDEITALGTVALNVWRERYGPIIHTNGSSFTYQEGVWQEWAPQHDQMLRALIQEGAAKLQMKPATALLNAAARYVMDRPELLESNVIWDQHGLIVAGDGVLNPVTMEIGPHSPDHKAMFKVAANLHGSRSCETFLSFLRQSFADKPASEIPAILETIQEWLGSILIANKPRALRKGVTAVGGSRTGKTQMSEIARGLLGEGKTSGLRAKDLEKDFGTQALVGKRGWIADDAVGQNEYLDAECYKVIVTGEQMSIRRKNTTNSEIRFGFAVFLTMNTMPRIRDGSDAVYNRTLVWPMTNVRPETAPEPIGYDSIAAKIIAEELTGVLWWAIEGWQRLSARGRFDPPKCMTKAVQDFQAKNDPVGTWANQCLIIDEGCKVQAGDLFASFAGWFFQENGNDAFRWSQNGFSRQLKEKVTTIEPVRDAKKRFLAGVRLNEDGLEYWTVNANRDQMRRTDAPSMEVYTLNNDHSPEPENVSRVTPAADRKPRF